MVKSARKVADYVRKVEEDFILISIADPEDAHVKIPVNPYCRGVLFLKFHDVRKKRKGKVLFGKRLAKKIKNFVEENKENVELLVCNCRGGVSRSPAVAAAISRVYNLDADKYFSFFEGRYVPNMLVYTKLLKVYRIKVNKSEIKRLKTLFISNVKKYARLE